MYVVRRLLSVVRQPFSSIFFSETTGLIKAKFHPEPQWDEGTKMCLWDLCHMTKMATMLIHDKSPLKIFFFQNRKADDFETWDEAFSLRAH